uniref:Disease resistance R13L4/SHOC-2-like LRR domain-containing protein n=1 Tax=Corethron hystrix TaxID=216773 RepID=A0A7S1BGZ6_9STRA|mmetsp:Transcript_27837/g.63755  ORF Transcript_27837/g.63755 Transcript_27837/m.63755 type:complete len:433 (+) Transcript_27837:144-1442(+)
MATPNYFLRFVMVGVLILAITVPSALGITIYENAVCGDGTNVFRLASTGTTNQECDDEIADDITKCHEKITDCLNASVNGNAANDCVEGAFVREYCPYTCGYLALSEDRSDICSDNRSRIVLKCISGTQGNFKWIKTGYCVDMICNKQRSDYEEGVKKAIETLEDGKPINTRAQQLMIDNRICDNSVNFAEIYGMYSLAVSLFILGIASKKPEACGGYESHDPCVWRGVYCISNKVIGIDLEGAGNPDRCATCQKEACRLTGTLPPQIEYLTNIKELNLGGNKIRGSIPPEIGKMTSLAALDLDRNEMTGSLPLALFELKQLYHLDLDTNCFNGPISNDLHKLEHLKVLSLHDNQFKGTIPSALTQLSKLSTLFLDCNQHLVGYFSRAFCTRHSNLEYFFADRKNIENKQNCGVKVTCVPVSYCKNKICTPP